MTDEAFCGASDDCLGANAGVACDAGNNEICLAGGCELCVAPEPGMMVFESTGVIDTFEVPACVTTITIDASGAQGGGLDALGGGGYGAQIVGDFDVTPGQSLSVVVGERGQLQIGGDDQNSSGGGGGSFVYDGDTLLVAAGGGGGRCNYDGSAPLHAAAAGSADEAGGADSASLFMGGVGGNGGDAGLWSMLPDAGGGAGWLSNGGSEFGGWNASGDWAGGAPFCGGGGGGCGGYGGFGGGGGGGNHYGGGGGGGGYSGGAGGSDPDHGGGGGSFNAGDAPTNTGGVQQGDGVIVISW